MLIRVPASSANLGAGFDSFGIAWNIYNTIEFSIDTERLIISGCEAEYCNEENLAYRAFCRTLEYAGKKAVPAAIHFAETDIPVSRGLGSSAALTAAGVTAANKLFGLGLSGEKLLQIASEMEGHPDNVAPALFGGFTVSVTDRGMPVTHPFPVSVELHFAALIPPFKLSTALSRSVLPDKPTRGDAVFNIGRAALLTAALAEGDCTLLKVAMQDKIHQDYRYPLIDGYEGAAAAAEECGSAAMCISGAGSTLLAVSDDAAFVSKMRKRMKELLPLWEVRSVRPDMAGTLVIDRIK